jgi:hypothetical protein
VFLPSRHEPLLAESELKEAAMVLLPDPQRYLEFDLLLMDVDISLLWAWFCYPNFYSVLIFSFSLAILLMDVRRLDYGI